jgi:hypothetical protein
MHIVVVYHRLIRISVPPPLSFLVLIINTHVLVKELNVVIFQGVHSFAVVCGIQ